MTSGEEDEEVEDRAEDQGGEKDWKQNELKARLKRWNSSFFFKTSMLRYIFFSF